jgi:uncharacterized membrane protein
MTIRENSSRKVAMRKYGFIVVFEPLRVSTNDKKGRAGKNKTWRRIMSRIGLLLGSLATAMAVYTAIAEARGALSQQLYYGSRTMSFGLGGSLAVIVVSAFAEGRLRRYLLLGAVGLLCFFSFGVGEAI